MVVAGFILAPRMGAIGAAIAQLIGTTLAILVLSWMVARSVRAAMKAGGQA